MLPVRSYMCSKLLEYEKSTSGHDPKEKWLFLPNQHWQSIASQLWWTKSNKKKYEQIAETFPSLSSLLNVHSWIEIYGFNIN